MRMEDFDMTRKQILELRILDLKDILEYAELNTEGARRALQDRVIEAARDDFYKLRSYISQLHSLRLRGKSRKFHPPDPQSSKRSRSLLRMDAMPYYDYHSDTIITTALIPSYPEKPKVEVLEVSPEFSIRFDLLDSQKELIFGTNDRFSQSSTARIILRLGVDQDKLLIEDEFPAGIVIIVNGRQVPLPDVLPSKPNHLTRRFPKPVDITDYLSGGIGRNSMTITWCESETRKFIVNVFCALKLEADELLRRLRSKPLIDERTTIELVRKFYDLDEELSMTTECKISLTCPLMITPRIGIPSRARSCTHVQCFDAESYIRLNQRRSRWQCPVCGERAYFCDLRVDKFYENILNSKNLSRLTTKITIDRLGNWHEEIKKATPTPSSVLKRPKRTESDVISLSSDDEGEVPPPERIPCIQRSYNAVRFGEYPLVSCSPSTHSVSSCPSSKLDEDIVTID